MVKNPPANAGDAGDASLWVRRILLEEGMAIHSSILAWRIPWTSPWDHKESDTAEQLSLSLDLI